MKPWFSLALTLAVSQTSLGVAREAKLVRYPHFHQGKVTFTYLSDIWTANEDGSNPQRITVNKARDYRSKFSPDGKWIAFSSDRNGNVDVFVMPAGGGSVRALTTHSADDELLNWNPDSKGVLFASQRGEDFMGRLYVVSIDGGMPRNAGPDMGVTGSFSPDGKRLAINRKSQPYWRKFYRGAYNSDVTVMDLAARTFLDLTDFDGMDAWPLYGHDGFVYFVSDREGKGLSNLWRVSDKGGPAEPVTTFTSGDVRFPAISGDGKTIVFEHDFGIRKLDLATRKTTPIRLDITAETQETLVEWREFNSEVDDYDVAPDGKRISVSIHGEVFTVPTDEGDLVQITDSPDRDFGVDYSPDGKLLAYLSDKDGRVELYTTPVDGTAPAKRITEIDALTEGYEWSPDSKAILLSTSDGKLIRIDADGKNAKELLASKYGRIEAAHWSPDSKWVVYARADHSRATDIYLLPSTGGEEKKITFDSSSESSPRFSSDGKKVYFLRAEGGSGNDGSTSSHVYVVPLERIDRDPAEVAAEAADNSPEAVMRRLAAARIATITPTRPLTIDWSGLKRRTRQVTPGSTTVSRFLAANDGKTIVFVGTEGGMGSPSTLYSIQDDGKRLSRITTSGITAADLTGPDRGRSIRRALSGMSDLQLTKDGRTVFFREGDGVYAVPMGGSPVIPGDVSSGGMRSSSFAALFGASGASAGGSSKKRVSYNVKVKIDRPGEWAEMFGDAWRTMKHRFYDPKMHGRDWDAMRAKYAPLVEYVGDRHELINLINEMIGELNASHTGASATGGRGETSGVSTGHLGLDLVADPASGLYKVAHVYEGGPADADWIKVSKGDYLISLNGRPIKAGDDYDELLNRRLNKKVALSFNAKPVPAGAWTVKYEPVSMAAFSDLRYRRWVDERRALSDKLSGGRVGYLHIKAMDPASLRKFEKELKEFRHKDALVIDERFNGGGNIEQELLALLVQRQYEIWHPRGTEPTSRPHTGFFGPKVVLQNWRSASNAEMFPAGFRALGLGKVIGTTTMGAVIGTGSYSLIDGSTIRTPAVGVYLNDPGRTNMENSGVRPDIYVENTPEDNLAGRDRQLEVAVKELLKDLSPSSNVAEK
jgi:tricorn protease